MDFDLNEEENNFREEEENFVRKEMPSDWDDRALYTPAGYGTITEAEFEFKDFTKQFIRKMGKKGWLSLGWPKQYGGMNSWMKQAIVNDIIYYYRLPNGGAASMFCGPTIVLVGNEEMKKEWLPRIASGEATFWLGYSEPDAGSDLGSLRTSATEDGDSMVVNGQKTWSTAAHVTDYCWLLANTNPNAPKHRNATLMIVDNSSPGITIQPIKNICGTHSFNEVFFDDVRVPKKNIVGEINQGFHNVMIALQFERLIVGTGTFKRVMEELVQYVKEIKYNGEVLAKNPFIRNKIAEMVIEIEMLYGFYWRTAWLMDKGCIPELEASALKLFATELSRKLANTGMDILGLYGQLERGSKWAPLRGRISLAYLDSISGPIGAGTSEVQRDIIATRGIGLPRN